MENNTESNIGELARKSEHFTLMALCFALACRELEQMSGITANEWSDRIGKEALALITDKNTPDSVVEDICVQVFNKGQKL